MDTYRPLHTLSEEEYFDLTENEFLYKVLPQLDALIAGIDASTRRGDIWTATNLALLLPRFMVADGLAEFATVINRVAHAHLQERRASTKLTRGDHEEA